MNIYDHISLLYPGHLCFLPAWKCVEHTLEFTAFPFQQRPGPFCWGSFCRCENFLHDIWGGWYNPSTPQGCLTYIFLYYVLFSYNHAHVRGIPVGILGASQGW